MNRSSDERVMAPGSRGIGAVFRALLPVKIPIKRGMLSANREFHDVAWSHYLSNAPGLADQLVASRKDSAREGGCPGGKMRFAPSAFFFKSCPSSRFAEIRAWTCEIWPPRTEATGVFLVRLRAVFRSGFRLDPDKILAIREFHVVHGCVFFPMCPGSQINLLRVRKTLCASVATSVGKFRNFQHNLISSACFHARGRRSSRCRISTILVSSESLRYLLFNVLDHNSPRFSSVFGPVKYRIEALITFFRMVKGAVSSIQFFGLVNSQVKPWSNLVNLGRIWSKLSKLWEMYPGPRFEGFLGQMDPSRAGNGSVKPWSNFGQPWSNLASLDHAGLVPGRPALRADTRENPGGVQMDIPKVENDRTRCGEVIGGSKGPFGAETPLRLLCSFAHILLSGTPIDAPFSPTRSTRLRSTISFRLYVPQMSDRGSGSGGHRRSDRLAKGKSVIYAPESPPDTDDEYDAMEDVRTRVDASLARDLQAEFDAEAAGLPSSTARPSSRPGITIGRSARPSSAPRQPTAAPPVAPPARSKRRKGGIRPHYPVTTPVVDTLLLTNLHNHPSSSVRRCQDPPESIGRGGWSEFSQLLDIARPEYRDFLVELGFGPFLSIRYVHVRHPLVRCWVERFFHHTGTIHLSTCEVGVLPVDWSAILGIRFGGRIPPSDPVSDFEAMEILGIDDPAAIVGKKLFHLKISFLKDLLVREIEEPPTELRYRQWTAYFIFSCFLGNDKSTIPTPIVGMFRDIDDLRDYDWGALTYGFYIRGLRRFSRRETASFLGFWQFTLFWAFEHFAVFAPSRLPAAPDSAFPLARCRHRRKISFIYSFLFS
uniref:Aminotransferase-like plant mobile domain-containing protein n=1 Tax=Fagus sylvatica TaxID=28930 RepID=A0A2N9HKL5_FAGSY